MKLEAFHPGRKRFAADWRRSASLRGSTCIPASPDEAAQLVAYLKTPRGLVELD
jgi:hypothetical protein